MQTRWQPCVCATTWHPDRHNSFLIWGRYWALKHRVKPRYKNSANLHSSTKHSPYNNCTPLDLNQATPNAYQMLALCLCKNRHPARHNPPLIWRRHWALKDRVKPRYKNSANLHSSTKHSPYNNCTPLEFNQATPNAYQMLALCLCKNMTPSQIQPSLNFIETLGFERQG